MPFPMRAQYGLCLTCYEILDPTYMDPDANYNICPRLNCHHEMVSIDENMLPIIITLNKKGYKTQQCCSSHLWDPNIYIDFEPGIQIPRALPEGFYLRCNALMEEFEGHDGPDMAEQKIQNSIYTEWDTIGKWLEKPMMERQRVIFDYLTRLLEWVDRLPESEQKER